MDNQSLKDKRMLKIIAIGMPIMVVLVIVFMIYLKSISDSILEPFKVATLTSGAIVVLCDKQALDIPPIQSAFDDVFYTKVSGSSPTRYESLKAEVNGQSIELTIGLDSRDLNLFWLYLASTETGGKPMGYIKSEYLTQKIEHCE
ncbi:hypothetical protein [Thalassotalea litorea]|uniref:hypothetical protein n=1 Tax=Thalassotalea litorea TaxID=2020715 RepID=UPI003736859B